MPTRNEPLDPDDIADVRRLVDAIGEQRAAQKLAVDPRTLVRALAGLGLHDGVRSRIAQRLAEIRGVT